MRSRVKTGEKLEEPENESRSSRVRSFEPFAEPSVGGGNFGELSPSEDFQGALKDAELKDAELKDKALKDEDFE